jgi:hypothetical protein
MSSAQRRAMQERLAAHARFDEWVSAHPTRLSPAAAVAAGGRLYDLLPPSSRTRPVDPGGVMTLHRLLRRTRVVR